MIKFTDSDLIKGIKAFFILRVVYPIRKLFGWQPPEPISDDELDSILLEVVESIPSILVEAGVQDQDIIDRAERIKKRIQRDRYWRQDKRIPHVKDES